MGEYREIARRLIEMKRAGYPLANSIGYLKVMAKEKNWQCKPWTMINIDPNGKVVLPCYVHNDYASSVSIFESGIKSAVSSLTGKKSKTAKNAVFTVMLSLRWCFQEILARICIGHLKLTLSFLRRLILFAVDYIY